MLWINAEAEEDLLTSFKTAAELLKRPAAHLQDTQNLLASMHEWFRDATDWLLILDNTDDIAPVFGPGSILKKGRESLRSWHFRIPFA